MTTEPAITVGASLQARKEKRPAGLARTLWLLLKRILRLSPEPQPRAMEPTRDPHQCEAGRAEPYGPLDGNGLEVDARHTQPVARLGEPPLPLHADPSARAHLADIPPHHDEQYQVEGQDGGDDRSREGTAATRAESIAPAPSITVGPAGFSDTLPRSPLCEPDTQTVGSEQCTPITEINAQTADEPRARDFHGPIVSSAPWLVEPSEMAKPGDVEPGVAGAQNTVAPRGAMFEVNPAPPNSSVTSRDAAPVSHTHLDDSAFVFRSPNSTGDTTAFPEEPEPRPAGEYRPRLGQNQRNAVPSRARRDSVSEAAAPAILDAELVLTFKPGGWGISVRILLRRKEGMAEEIAVRLGPGAYDLCAIGDDFFEPIQIDGLALDQGVAAQAAGSTGARWVRTGRSLHAFAARAGVAGFVSVPRVIIGQENALLCTSDLARAVLQVCSEIGSPAPVEVLGPGIPEGWRCFRGIRPQAVVPYSGIEGALLALVPLPDATIDLSGGISINRSAWLFGYPPLIRILGAIATLGELTIDGQPALSSEGGTWTSPGYDSCGAHIVRYLGISRSYDISEAPKSWDRWGAHSGNGYAVCGALVTTHSGHPTFAVVGNPVWLIGRVPGEIVQAFRVNIAAPAVAAPSFHPVWTIPVNSGQGPARQLPRLLGGQATAPLRISAGIPQSAVRLWCSVIRNASRNREDWQALEGEVAELWKQYRRAARSLRKRRSR